MVLEKIDSIELANISFNYGDDSKNVLEELSLSIHSGQTIALVGPSGSGKSTLVKLILGLYEKIIPNAEIAGYSGDIRYNDVSLPKIDINELRHHIGYVPQDTQVFAGTIRENLLFVAPHATDEQCLDALQKSQALHIIERTDKGLDTVLGENGIKLSGGERQRIAIARALLRQPDILIFDEATSSLDSLTEHEITKTIQNIRKTFPNLMMVIVAHRLSTIEHVDVIHAMKNGTLVESGSHKELLAKKSLYYSLWNQQH
ncbi:MAG: ABC transporter ATP-binding protein [Minisyncoccia bacterium]